MPGIRDALEKIKTTVVDFSSLEVITFRGDITAYIETEKSKANDPLNWDKMLADAKAKGQMKIALSSLVNFDGDVQHFISDPEPPQWVIDSHKAAVESSLEARRAILDLFKDTVQEVLTK